MSNELKVALAVLVSIAAIYAGVRFLSGQPLFGAGYEVVTVFDDAQGLAAGGIVRLNGVRVGEVGTVELGPSAREVFVTLRIDRGIEIPRGALVQTSGLSALGEVNVEISPPAGAGAGRPLASGDTLYASSTPDLFDLIAGESNSLTARADTALAGAASTFTILQQTLENSSGDITALLSQARFLTQAATRTLIDERARIDRTLGSLEAAAANASSVSTAVGNDVRDLSVVVGNDVVAASGAVRSVAEANADSVTVAVARINASMRRLEAGLTNLESLSARLDTTLASVNSPEGTLGLMLNDPSLYYNANAAAASLQQLLQDFQNDPGRYLRDLDGVVRVF
jgi:phospholipid/cholesterol/gamma-HCH transport system substrate-binding protein